MFLKIRYWIPIGIALTIICSLIYASGQQILRQSANDPQIQIAEDISQQLSQGETRTPIESGQAASTSVDLNNSLAPFVITYDQKGNVVMSTAKLHDSVPPLPRGVLESTSYTSQNRLTWQPAKNVRISAIVNKFGGTNGGYVLVGRSLQEVEKREDQLLLLTFFGWVTAMASSLIAAFLVIPSQRKK